MPKSNMTPTAPDDILPEESAAPSILSPKDPSGDSDPEPEPAPDPVTALENEVASLKDQLLRRRAEFDNYRRRVERDQRAAAEDAVISMLQNLLPSLDALEKALAAEGTLEEIRKGVEITLNDVGSTLGAQGVRIEDPTGDKFDPLRHQALSYEPVPGAADGVVVACYRKGYIMGERLIRPALVKVAQQAAEDTSAAIVPESN